MIKLLLEILLTPKLLTFYYEIMIDPTYDAKQNGYDILDDNIANLIYIPNDAKLLFLKYNFWNLCFLYIPITILYVVIMLMLILSTELVLSDIKLTIFYEDG